MRIDPNVPAFNAYRQLTTSGHQLNKNVQKLSPKLQESPPPPSRETNQNSLERTISHLRVERENVSASESQIRNANMAIEMLGLTRQMVTSNADGAILAQANLVPESVLRILGD